MGTDIKQLTPVIYTALLFVASLTVAQGRDYVPPPSGPYQSSVVINNSPEEDSQQQVYKFPPPDILLDDKKMPAGLEFQPDMYEPAKQMAPAVIDLPKPQQRPPTMNSQPLQSMPESGSYSQWPLPQGGQPAGNPGWYGYQNAAPNYNQNVWQQGPGYGYQQQYPYSYGNPNQYNGSNTPYYGMPSPWSVMPRNPFFSDK